MSTVMLKSLVSKLKTNKKLTVNDIISTAQLSSETTPLIDKIQEYLKKHVKLSHAQYYELIAMANGCANFDTFNATLGKNLAMNVQVKEFTTGSILLDHFLKQFDNSFKIKVPSPAPNSILFKKLENEEETLKVIDTLNLVRDDKGIELRVRLHKAVEEIRVLNISTQSSLCKEGLKEILIPLRKLRSLNQSIVHQEEEILQIAVALNIVDRRGGIFLFKEQRFSSSGRMEALKALAESPELLEKIKLECVAKMDEQYLQEDSDPI